MHMIVLICFNGAPIQIKSRSDVDASIEKTRRKAAAAAEEFHADWNPPHDVGTFVVRTRSICRSESFSA